MKKIYLIYLLCITVIMAPSCGQSWDVQGTDTKSADTLKQIVKKKAETFVDSVFKKMELSVTQVRMNVGIDTMYTNNSSIFFKGDTVYYTHSSDPIAVIRFDESNCSGKFLLVYRLDRITDKVLVSADCDRDSDVGYTSLNYKMLSDTSFYTEERYVERGAGANDKETMIKTRYTVNKKGKLIAQKESPKVRSIAHEEL